MIEIIPIKKNDGNNKGDKYKISRQMTIPKAV